MADEKPLWQPAPGRIASSNMLAFMHAANARWGTDFSDYAALWQWSVDSPEQFWTSLWDFSGVIATAQGERVLFNGNKMPGARWFPDARLNFAQNLLRLRGKSDALVFWGEDKLRLRLTHAELYAAVAQLAAALRGAGIQPGDRVAAYLPNLPQAVIAILGLVLLLLAPIFAKLMQFSVSRRREQLADITGVTLTRYPPGLASALRKLRDDSTVVSANSRAAAHLWIESPLDREGKRGAWLNRLFDSHPPIEERIRVLEAL